MFDMIVYRFYKYSMQLFSCLIYVIHCKLYVRYDSVQVFINIQCNCFRVLYTLNEVIIDDIEKLLILVTNKTSGKLLKIKFKFGLIA